MRLLSQLFCSIRQTGPQPLAVVPSTVGSLSEIWQGTTAEILLRLNGAPETIIGRTMNRHTNWQTRRATCLHNIMPPAGSQRRTCDWAISIGGKDNWHTRQRSISKHRLDSRTQEIR